MSAEPSSTRAFWLSCALHGLVVLAVVAVGFWSRLRKEEPIHVFELVSLVDTLPEAPAPPQTVTPAPQPEDPPPLRMETLEPLREPPPVNLAPLPEPPPPAPPPPPPAPEPPRQIRFEDWARDRNLPAQTQRVPQPRPQPAPTARIDTNIRERLQSAADLRVENYQATTAAESSAMDAYLNEIRARLRAAFDPIGKDLVARARFQVDASGRITQVDIVESSGNRAFDDSVRRTFDRIGSFRPPPSGRAHTWTTTFRSTE